jgi:hypothetical protein
MKSLTLAEKKRRVVVDPLHIETDKLILILGAMGQSDRMIIETLKGATTPARIHYRLRKYDIRRWDFRNGEGILVRTVLAQARPIADSYIERQIRDKL